MCDGVFHHGSKPLIVFPKIFRKSFSLRISSVNMTKSAGNFTPLLTLPHFYPTLDLELLYRSVVRTQLKSKMLLRIQRTAFFMKIYSVNLRIQSKYPNTEKCEPEKSPYLDTFYAVAAIFKRTRCVSDRFLERYFFKYGH